MKNYVIILAGGIGKRMGLDVPKQFIEVLGKPVLAYTIEAFEKHPEIDAILVVCVKTHIDYMWEMKEKYGLNKLKWITEGGSTFQGSVLNGVRYLEDKIERDDIVLSTGLSDVTECLFALIGNILPITCSYLIPVMNSPHAFRFGFIDDLYKDAIETGIIDTVEPHTTTLMYAMGKKIYFALGSQNNIKITRKEDLELFEGYVLEQERKCKETVIGDVIVLLADGFEESEGLIVVDLLRRAGLNVIMASVMGRRDVKSSREVLIRADCLAENTDFNKAQLLVLPGGRIGTQILGKSDLVREQCLSFAKDRMVAAICAAPTILASLGLMKKATVHPDFMNDMNEVEIIDEPVVVDGNIITGQGLGATIPFALKIVETIVGTGTSDKIKKAICYRDN